MIRISGDFLQQGLRELPLCFKKSCGVPRFVWGGVASGIMSHPTRSVAISAATCKAAMTQDSIVTVSEPTRTLCLSTGLMPLATNSRAA